MPFEGHSDDQVHLAANQRWLKVKLNMPWTTLQLAEILDVSVATLQRWAAFALMCHKLIITPAIATPMPEGRGSKTSSTYVDEKGDNLDGSKTCRLRVPPNELVREFWSITVYDPATRSQLKTSQPLPSIISQQSPPANAEG